MDVSNAPLNAAERAGLRSFRRAALSSRGYRAHLERLGVDHRHVTRLAQVPYTDKRTVFGDHLELWLDGGRVADAAELLTSSGQTGLFSMGVTSRSERRAQERTLDLALRQLGASEESPTLVLNCLPMGISIPTRLATVATPSVHLEMALELLDRAGSGFDRVVIAAEPLFLKEMGETALREKGPGFADRVVACFVGGEWVAESWRRYVSELFGFAKDAEPAGGRAGVDGRRRGGPARAARDARAARGPPGPGQPTRAHGAVRPRSRLLAHPPHLGPEPPLHGGATARRRGQHTGPHRTHPAAPAAGPLRPRRRGRAPRRRGREPTS